MLRVVFMGSDSFSVPILAALFSAGPRVEEPLQIVAVVTQPDRAAGRGRKIGPNAVKSLALDYAIPVQQPARVRDPDAVQQILTLAPDVLIVASFGQLLPATLIETPPHKCVNVHPSLLPRHRGPSPIAAAILAGDTVTGVSLMRMVLKMDAGPVLHQETLQIGESETTGELSARLARRSAEILLTCLSPYVRGELPARPQDESAATYTGRLHKRDGAINWEEDASTIVRRVRAYNPWPAAFTMWGERTVRILRARSAPGNGVPGKVIGEREHMLAVATGSGVLLIEEMQLSGGKVLPAQRVLRGHAELRDAHFHSAF